MEPFLTRDGKYPVLQQPNDRNNTISLGGASCRPMAVQVKLVFACGSFELLKNRYCHRGWRNGSIRIVAVAAHRDALRVGEFG